MRLTKVARARRGAYSETRGDSVGQSPAQTDADQEAEAEQRSEIVGIDGQQCRNTKDHRWNDDAHAPAIAIGIPTEEH